MAKYVIVGFIKCGQISLYNKLKSEGHEVGRMEVVTNPLGPKMIKKDCPGHQPIIIMRDPIKRIWSQYEYLSEKFKEFREPMTFEQYCHYWRPHSLWFNENPIFQSNYAEHLERWVDENTIIVYLEDLIKEPDFPRENEGMKKTKMSEKDRKFATKMLKEYQNVLKGRIKVAGTGKAEHDKLMAQAFTERG
jgi:hypothetical protein